MTNIALIIDVGGTNTRANLYDFKRNKITKYANFNRLISSKINLSEFIEEIIKSVSYKEVIKAVFLAFAGPILYEDRLITMSNWKSPNCISFDEIQNWSIPTDKTYIINDLEAGAFGLISLIESSSTNFEILYGEAQLKENIKNGNKLIILPGTGLGCVGIVEIAKSNKSTVYKPLSIECQHTTIPHINKLQQMVMSLLLKNAKNSTVTWEDFISGRGLVSIYNSLTSKTHRVDTTKILKTYDPAEYIAYNAMTGEDKLCCESLNLYYQCLGRFAQLMALTFKPSGGIFLAGSTSIKNKTFIQHSDFLNEYLNNSTQLHLLKKFPIFIVLDELNINGMIWLLKKKNYQLTYRLT